MKQTLTVFLLGLIFAACSGPNAKVDRQITGTWYKDVPFNPERFSWIVPSRTFSADGSFSQSSGPPSDCVTYQGTWFVKGHECVMTFTNLHCTGITCGAGPLPIVDRCKIVSLDDHNFVFVASNGRKYVWTR
jgi:hypothetical protein